MLITEDVKNIIEGSAFLAVVTLGADGNSHPIVVGKGEVDGDKVLLGIYKMETTQANLSANSSAWIVAATMDGGPKGVRLSGTATVNDKQVIFATSKVDELI